MLFYLALTTNCRSCGSLKQASIAQQVEHFTRNEGVTGSNPAGGLKEKRKTCKNRFSVFYAAKSPSLPG